MDSAPTTDICYPKAVKITSIFTIVIACIGLAGWIWQVMFLARIKSEYIPIAPLTAIFFILLGSGLLALTMREDNKKIFNIVKFLAVTVAAGSLIIIVQYLLGVDYLESLILEVPGTLDKVPTGRMSPITAISFLLAGVALMLLSSHILTGKKYPSGVLSFAFLVISTVVFLGYIYRTPLLYGGDVIPMALNTSVAFIFFGCGLICAAGPDF